MKKTYLEPFFDSEVYLIEDVMTVSTQGQGEGAEVDVGGLI